MDFGGHSALPPLSLSTGDGSVQRPLLRPVEIGCLSVDHNRDVHFDRSQMKFYVPRPTSGLSLDLSDGYEDTIIKIYDVSERMEHLLKWIVAKGLAFVDPRSSRRAEFVTLRGTLQTVLCTPYFPGHSSEVWTIYATRFKGIIYFRCGQRDASDFLPVTERGKLMKCWGFKFEQYMTADRPYGRPDLMSRIHQLEEFSTILSNSLNGHSLIYKAEIDGIHSSRRMARPGDTSQYVELKTSRMFPKYCNDAIFHRSKSLKWWAQSYIVGVQDVICGLRDREGIVRGIEEFKTSRLPNQCQGCWRPDVCFNFCNKFLQYLKDIVVEDNHRVVYKLDYSAGTEISCQRFVCCPGGRDQVIPDWYAAELNRRFP